jgi:hypothetical protein
MYQLGSDRTDFRKISFIVDSITPSSAMQIEGIVAFPWQQCLPECAKMSRYTSSTL